MEDVVSDDYGHVFLPSRRAVEGHYFEIHRNNIDEDIYYLYYLDSHRFCIFSFGELAWEKKGLGNSKRCSLLTRTCIKVYACLCSRYYILVFVNLCCLHHVEISQG